MFLIFQYKQLIKQLKICRQYEIENANINECLASKMVSFLSVLSENDEAFNEKIVNSVNCVGFGD